MIVQDPFDSAIPAWVDGRLQPVGKLRAHLEGLRHRAVSVFVTDQAGGEMRVLLQKRAAGKYHTPNLWANTCCTHPHWQEADADCARRRLAEELGITGLAPVPAGQVEYRAEVGGGMIEHEVVALFRAEAAEGLHIAPDPTEVAETRWVTLPRLLDEIARTPEIFTPWLKIYLSQHRRTIFP